MDHTYVLLVVVWSIFTEVFFEIDIFINIRMEYVCVCVCFVEHEYVTFSF